MKKKCELGREVHKCYLANSLLIPEIIQEFVKAIELPQPEIKNVYNLAWSRLLYFLFPEEQGFYVSPQHVNILDPYFEEVGNTAGKKRVDFVVIFHVNWGNILVLIVELKYFASF